MYIYVIKITATPASKTSTTLDWYIVYKGKTLKGSLKENLDKAGVIYYIPLQTVVRFQGDRMVEHTENVFNNLIFLRTDKNILQVTRDIDGLKSPFVNRATGKPAIVHDDELQHFKKILETKSLHAEFLPDAYRRFETCPRVRVKAGEFEGMEGRVFRIRRDRKIIIALDDIAVAISGIHHTLLEIIE